MSARQRLFELWAEIQDLGATEELLAWDQETYMPEAAQPARGKLLATLAGIKHERLTSSELADCLASCREQEDDELAGHVRQAERAVHRARRLPGDLARALAEAVSDCLAAWRTARAERSFAPFAPALGRLVDLKRQEAAAVAPEISPYDALLDEYEPGLRASTLEPLFADLSAELAAVVDAVRGSTRSVDDTRLRGHYPPAAQLELGRWVAEQIGFDFQRGRLDRSAHPFCVGLDPDDVRLTWHPVEEDFRPGLFGILHEAGHGLYEQGLPTAWRRTPLGTAASFGIHESQSRLWENQVGRSLSFWRFLLPRFRDSLPHLTMDADEIWPLLHVVNPSLVRVHADETTYNLHIAIRFRIESSLVAGELEVDDLPEAWDGAYEELLGLRPSHPVEGALQDIHWASGLFGYFPSYTLGTLLSAQLWEAAERELGDLDDGLAKGETAPLLDWLRRNVHSHGARLLPEELVRQATGSELRADAFLACVRETAERVYGTAVGPTRPLPDRSTL